MSNDFLDNYKKKSEQGSTELAGNVEKNSDVQSERAVRQNSSVAPTPESNNASNLNFEQKSGFVKPTASEAAATLYTASGGNPKNNNSDNIFKKIPIQYYVIAGVAVILIIVLIIIFSGGTAAPAMVGRSLSDAELWANENKILLTSEKEYSDEVPEGEIISQAPAEGEKIDSSGFLEVILSLGPDPDVMITIPDNFMSMSLAEVESWAEENLMSAVRVTTDESDTVEQGVMIEYTINDDTVFGNEVKRSTPIYAVFSKGAGEGEPVELPNFLTMSLAEAEKFGEDNDIVIEIEEIYHDTVAKGMIISQSIKAEEVVRTGDTVVIEVSLGEEILVPNFFSYDRERASMIAAQEGITILTKEIYSGLDEDKLISQSMTAGSIYQQDDIVELTYSLGNSFVLPSFIGSNETAVREWVTPKNELGANITVNTRYTVSDTAKGTILSQEAYDVTVGITFTINLVVSSGGVVYAPDLVDESGLAPVTREMAIKICSELGIVPVFTEKSHGSRFWPGEVWAQNIPAGTEMKEGGTIELTVNPLDVGVKVPSFIDMTEAMAKSSAEGLTVKITVGEYVSGKAGLVTAQSLTSGNMVAPGTIIELTVGGPLSIPNFVGLTKAAVNSMSVVKSGDLKVVFNYPAGETDDDVVASQTPNSGDAASTGATVTLTMEAPPPTPTPDP